jgi:hypothetical protein
MSPSACANSNHACALAAKGGPARTLGALEEAEQSLTKVAPAQRAYLTKAIGRAQALPAQVRHFGTNLYDKGRFVDRAIAFN